MEATNIPDVVFLVLGIVVLMVLISIRNQLKRIAARSQGRRRHRQEGMSFEEQYKLRVKYLHQNRVKKPA